MLSGQVQGADFIVHLDTDSRPLSGRGFRDFSDRGCNLRRQLRRTFQVDPPIVERDHLSDIRKGDSGDFLKHSIGCNRGAVRSCRLKLMQVSLDVSIRYQSGGVRSGDALTFRCVASTPISSGAIEIFEILLRKPLLFW